MGSFLFTWTHPAKEVHVTGDFDDWGKTIKLDKVGDRFEKLVPIAKPDQKHLYKFVINDNEWTTDHTAPQEADGSGNMNNVLHPKDINKVGASEAIMTGGSTAPTTAALAGAVPKENTKASGDPTITGASAGPTTQALAGQVPKEGGSSDLPGSFPETPANESQQFSVKPVPASGTLGNPIHLKPGEPVPDPSTISSNTVESTVRSGDQDPAAAFGGPKQSQGTANTQKVIPESGLPMGAAAASQAAASGPTIMSSGAGSTTAQLAGQVPKEPRGVPEVVSKSQQEASSSPEAAANPTAVEEKKEVEQELTSKVPEEAPASGEGSVGGKVAGIAAGATAGVTAALGGAAAYFGSGKAKDDAKDKLPERTHGAVDKAAEGAAAAKGKLPESAQSTLDKGTAGATADKAQAIAPTVPDEVQKSISNAHQSPEAAANETAVKEKAQVESELLKHVKKEDMGGDPAPTVTAATSETAPKANLKSTEQPLGNGKAGTAEHEKSTEKSLAGGAAGTTEVGKSTETPLAGSATGETTEGKSTTQASDTAAATSSTSTPGREAIAAASQPRDSRDISPMSRPEGGSAAASPTTPTSASGKRKSGLFQKLKDKFENRKHKDKA